jgi:tetratricopeptide (TPR) repeat protein
LIQVFLEPCEPPLFFGERQGVDLSNWNGAADDPRVNALITAARAVLKGERPPEGVGYVPKRIRWGGWVAIAAALTLIGVFALDLGGARGATCRVEQIAEPCLAVSAALEPNQERRAQLYVAIADRQIVAQSFDAAIENLERAVAADPHAIGAHLRLGRVHFEERRDADRAVEHLRRAEQLTRTGGDATMRAETLYLLSRVEMSREQPRANIAMRDADEAFQLNPTRAHREQACLVRIRFAPNEDDDYQLCEPSADATDAAAHLLYGLYWLRRSYFPEDGGQIEYFARAFEAFSDGVEALGDPVSVDNLDVNARLEVGTAIVAYCLGMTVEGSERIASVGRDLDAARRFYRDLAIDRCPPSGDRSPLLPRAPTDGNPFTSSDQNNEP